jgi:F-type H+-transporting ATPase subunit b
MKPFLRCLFVLALLSLLAAVSSPAFAQAQDHPAANPASEPKQADAQPQSMGGELAKEEREATGAEEEHADLKHSSMIRKFARMTGLSDHQAHLVALTLNFAFIVFLIFWFGRKSVPGMLRNRNQSIQRALEEARAASQDANRRLAEIETRLRQLDVEIGQMQAHAEKEAEAEEVRIRSAADDDIRKVVEAAEQEIAAAAKLARRELTAHTADLAIALARKQINVDSNTDQVLVRNFAVKLAQDGGKGGN